MSSFCSVCQNKDGEPLEFPSVKELSEHLKSGHKLGRPKPKSVAPKTDKGGKVAVAPKPIVLKYKYEGKCPTCQREVDTIKVEMSKDEHVMIAFCNFCKIQPKQTKVKPIK